MNKEKDYNFYYNFYFKLKECIFYYCIQKFLLAKNNYNIASSFNSNIERLFLYVKDVNKFIYVGKNNVNKKKQIRETQEWNKIFYKTGK
jgi:hypothetical protein